MPVQTQTRSQPPPDPFSDPNPIRLVTSKVSPKRDTAMDNSRESPAQDQYRTKPIRSQTQQTVGSVDHTHILRRARYSLFLLFPSILAVVPKPLLAALYLRTLPQHHLSQKKPIPPSARRNPPTQTLSIVLIFQVLVRVRTSTLDCSTAP